MRLSFPFQYRGEGYLGRIYRPYAQVTLSSDKIDEWIPIELIVDTGADYTLLPKKYSSLLQINLKSDCRVEKTFGVGGREIVYQCKSRVKFKIASFERIIPVGFLDRDDIPPLLGRLQALELLSLVIKNKIVEINHEAT